MVHSLIAGLNAVDNGLGADGEIIEVLRILTKLINGSYASTFSSYFIHSFSYTPRNIRWHPRYHILQLPRRTHYRSPIACWCISLRPQSEAGTRATTTLQRSTVVRGGHRIVMDAPIPFVASLSRATTFGDAVEVCKMGGESTELGEGDVFRLILVRRVWCF